MDQVTRRKWNSAARSYDLINAYGPEWRWAPWKEERKKKQGKPLAILALVCARSAGGKAETAG